MIPITRISGATSRTTQIENEMGTLSDKSERIVAPTPKTVKQELDTFFAQSTPAVPPDLIRIIASYAYENLPLALANSRRNREMFSFESLKFLEPDKSRLVFEDPQCQEEIGAIMCALSASSQDVDPVHKQIILNSFTAGGMQELVKIVNEMSRIGEKINLNQVKFSMACMTGPCNLDEVSAIGIELRSVKFEKISMRGANFNESQFISVALLDVDLSNASLSGALLKVVEFNNVNIAGLRTSDKRLLQFMEKQRGKNSTPDAALILNGVLDYRGLTLTDPERDQNCSTM